MATFTASQAVDMRDVFDAPITSAEFSGFNEMGNYFQEGPYAGLYIEGTGLGFADGRPTATTMSMVEQIYNDNVWWIIRGTDFYDPTFTGYTDGYDYGGNVGVLYGMNAEVAWWLRGHDTVNGSGGDDFLRGYDGNDVINGNNGDDSLAGNRGNDTVHGGDGDDIVNGGGGTNLIDGGVGRDTLRYDWATLGVTVDLRLATAQATGVSTDTISGVENLIGSDYADTFYGRGGYDNQYGGDGKDKLFGNGGNDSLYGEKGKDVLVGGAGADDFVFDTKLSSNNIDTIRDFSVGEDWIALDHDIFKVLSPTDELSADNFVANASGTAMDADDYIVYDTDSGMLFYDKDGTGAGAAVQFAQIGISTHAALTAADFAVY